jgi:hypothetical protein
MFGGNCVKTSAPAEVIRVIYRCEQNQRSAVGRFALKALENIGLFEFYDEFFGEDGWFGFGS